MGEKIPHFTKWEMGKIQSVKKIFVHTLDFAHFPFCKVGQFCPCFVKWGGGVKTILQNGCASLSKRAHNLHVTFV